MPPRKTIGQKRAERQAAQAAAPKATPGGDRIDKVVKSINTMLGGQGRVFRGSDIEKQQWERRSTGIPSLDYVLNGGLPVGGLVEIGGEFSTGKTTVCLHTCKQVQRTTEGAVGWVALEPFSKRWARENGFFIPFCEERGDSYEAASELEKFRMEQAGITDPYQEVSPFVLVQEERGDVALDAALAMLESNQFEIIVVDSLGVAKSTKWITDNQVQDAGDFPREAKMIGDYTTRAGLMLNRRYDENGNKANDGEFTNRTTLIHLNHITTVVGTQARAAYKKYSLKGGEGNKHNHHAILFLWKGDQKRVELPGGRPYIFGQEIRVHCIKSKIGPPELEGSYDFYFQPYEQFQPGDIDVVKDAVGLALVAGVFEKSGAWYSYHGERWQGREAVEAFFRENTEWLDHLVSTTTEVLRR